jgi:hypothetical protein
MGPPGEENVSLILHVEFSANDVDFSARNLKNLYFESIITFNFVFSSIVHYETLEVDYGGLDDCSFSGRVFDSDPPNSDSGGVSPESFSPCSDVVYHDGDVCGCLLV